MLVELDDSETKLILAALDFTIAAAKATDPEQADYMQVLADSIKKKMGNTDNLMRFHIGKL